MSSRVDLKVLNVNSTNILREVFINCDKVTVCSLSSGEYVGIGAHGSLLTIAKLSSPCDSQVMVVSCASKLKHELLTQAFVTAY